MSAAEPSESLVWRTVEDERGSGVVGQVYTDRLDVEDGYLLRTWHFHHDEDFAEWRIFAQHHIRTGGERERGDS